MTASIKQEDHTTPNIQYSIAERLESVDYKGYLNKKTEISPSGELDNEELLKLILTISTNFIVLTSEDIDEGINDVLKILGLHANADRSYVFLIDNNFITNTHEWCAEGIETKKQSFVGINLEHIPWFISKIRNFEIINIPDMEVLSSKTKDELKYFMPPEVKSLIVVPIVAESKVLGFIGIEKHKEKRIWPESLISLLKIIRELFASAIFRKHMSRALRESEKKYRDIFNNTIEGIFQITPEGKILSINPSFASMHGYNSPQEMIAHISELQSQILEEPDEFLKIKKILEEKGYIEGYEIKSKKNNGEIFWASMNARAIRNEKNEIIYFEGTLENINERKNMELLLKESEERYRILAEQSPVGVYLVQDGVFKYVNRVFAEIHGYKQEEIINRLTPRDLTYDVEGKPVEQVVKEILSDKGKMKLEVMVRRKDGSIRYGEIHGSKVIYHGRPAVLGTLLDVTEKKEMEEKLKSLTITDELTGVYNRRGFFTVSEQQFKLAKRLGKNLLIFFADLDGLKWINDNLGHKEGDTALIAFVNILKESFRETDIIGRLGGDEFAVLALLTGSTNARLILNRLHFFTDAYNLKVKKPYKLSFSIGVVEFDPVVDNSSLEELITKADNLMYVEKKEKKREYQFQTAYESMVL